MINFDRRANLLSINGRFLGRQRTGVDRFAFECVMALDRVLDTECLGHWEGKVNLYVPSDSDEIPPLKNVGVEVVGRLTGALWEQIELAVRARNSLLVNLCNAAPILLSRQLTVIHDIAPQRVPDSYGTAFKLWYGYMVPLLYHRSKYICTVSEFSRRELRSCYGPRTQVSVLPEGVDHMESLVSDGTILSRHNLKKNGFILAVGSQAPHKNFRLIGDLMDGNAVPGVQLVVAGGSNSRVFSMERDRQNGIKYVGYVTDSELKALYQNALCFVFPSLYEGYGLPPTEAMACGCPVLASSAAAIPEVCGDAALYFNAGDAASLRRCIDELLSDGALRSELQHRGALRVATMRWERTARALLGIVKSEFNILK